MMKTSISKRILSALLAFVMVIGYFPVRSWAESAEETFRITYEGQTVTAMDVPRNEKRVITAEAVPEGKEYQWEIKVPSAEFWVKIHGQTTRELGLSYALLGSLLDSEASAYVRCAAMDNGTAVAYTESLRATVTEPEVEILEPDLPEFIEETTAPTEETTVPTEETTAPTEEATTPTEETTAPTEEATTPTEETTAPTEEATTPTEETTAPTEEATTPTEETTAPTEETMAPTEETTAPTEESTVPTEETTVPTEETTTPTEESTAPTEQVTVPTEIATVPTEEPTAPIGETLMADVLSMFALTASAEEVEENAETQPEMVTITIQYLRKIEVNGTKVERQIFNPYTAKLQKGAAFTVSVPVPTYVGYYPTLDDPEQVTDPARISTVELSYPVLTEDEELKVYYVPDKVNVAARYHIQNVYNDLYLAHSYIEGKAKTGTYPEYITLSDGTDVKMDKEIPGFTKLYNYPEVVAADGSTEFQIYYDRNYYLYIFDLDGGYGVEPIYARYETDLIIGDPTKSGWTFDDWDLVSISTDSSITNDGVKDELTPKICVDQNGNTVLGNYTYKARWTRFATTFTVIYWVENANDDGYSYVSSIEGVWGTTGDVINLDTLKNYENPKNGVQIPTTLPDSALVNYVARNDTETENHYDKDADGNLIDYDGQNGVQLNGDGSSIFNIYYSRNRYYIKFYYARSYVKNDGTTQFQVANETGGASNQNGSYSSAAWDNDVENLELTLPETTEVGRFYHSDQTVNSDNGKNYHYFVLKAKYGENIEDYWPHGHVTANDWNFVSWSTQYGTPYNKNSNRNIKGTYSKMDSDIIKETANQSTNYSTTYEAYEAQFMVGYWNTANLLRTWDYNIYVEPLPGESTDGKTIAKFDGEEYLYLEDYDVLSRHDNQIGSQTNLPFEGFSYKGKESVENSRKGSGTPADPYVEAANFFYTRNVHDLTFNNYDGTTYKTESVPYGAPLASYLESAGTPPYPSSLEPGAYVFDGWYTGPNKTGDKLDGTTAWTMEDADLILFAFWKPVSYTIPVYATHTDMNSGTGEVKTLTVEHGKIMDTSVVAELRTKVELQKPSTSAVFSGWFYEDEMGNIQAFEPGSMAVTGNIKLFAQWKTSDVAEYTVYYRYVSDSSKPIDDESRYTYFTDPVTNEKITTTGHAYVSGTKTFFAKAFPQKDGKTFYPDYGSTSIVIDADSEENKVYFTYQALDRVSYTVKYWCVTEQKMITADGVTNPETKESTDAVIDVPSVYVDGHLADASYKRLYLSSDSANNVVIFNYNHDDKHARYVVRHEVESLTSTATDPVYEEYAVIDNVGDIGETMYGSPLPTITGFEYDEAATRAANSDTTVYTVDSNGVRAELTKAGLEMTVRYKRCPYNYTIQFMEYGTVTQLKDPVTVTGVPYGTVVTPYTDGTGTSNVPDTIEVTEDETEIEYKLVSSEDYDQTSRTLTIRANNEQTITYFYEADAVMATYIPLSYDGSGAGGYCSPGSENVKTKFAGSTPTPNPGFRFVKWLATDADGTQRDLTEADGTVGTDGKLIPKKTGTDDLVFYAVFEPIKLTIAQTGIAPKESAVYEIVKDNFVILTVSITGEGSKVIEQLPKDDYTIREAGWTWTYDGKKSQNVTVTGADQTVTFNYADGNPDWLHGENHQ